jgi:hypothetical protein
MNNMYELEIGDVRGWATSPGMEIVAKYDGEDANCIFLRDALAIHLQELDPGKMRLEFLPPSFFCECDEKFSSVYIRLNKSLILFPYKPRKDVYEGYLKRTGSIVPVTASSIIQPR